ncbi:hypothetical protein CASFOL_030834 [Castilleja foliolosa]|uniref:Phospholipase A(2) n=1 Tax=Castilleja foliolosa TaxID=1961234 RepID=A0ABD3C6F1_9LAMI
MASKLVQLKSKACQATQFVTKNGNAYYKQLLEQNKQYIKDPPTVDTCSELSKQLLYTRLASIPGRTESFWKEIDCVKNLWKNRQELKVEDAGIAALFGLECFAWFCADFECSKTCVVQDCNRLWMRYGKYCGVGYSGCPGEKPCDDLDACCQLHDDCVDQHGMSNIECHEECKRCISKILGNYNKSDEEKLVGFSKSCPYEVAVPTLLECMDVSILFSQHHSSSSSTSNSDHEL